MKEGTVYINISENLTNVPLHGRYCVIRGFDENNVTFSVAADDQPRRGEIVFNDSTFTIRRDMFERNCVSCGEVNRAGKYVTVKTINGREVDFIGMPGTFKTFDEVLNDPETPEDMRGILGRYTQIKAYYKANPDKENEDLNEDDFTAWLKRQGS